MGYDAEGPREDPGYEKAYEPLPLEPVRGRVDGAWPVALVLCVFLVCATVLLSQLIR